MLCVSRGPDRDLKEMLEVGNKNLKGGKQPLNLCPGPRPFRLRELAEHSAHIKLPSATFGCWSRHGVKLSGYVGLAKQYNPSSACCSLVCGHNP